MRIACRLCRDGAGDETRAWLRGADLAVAELQSIATLPDDHWRDQLSRAAVQRLLEAFGPASPPQ